MKLRQYNIDPEVIDKSFIQIPYGDVVDNYKFSGVQNGFGVSENINLYTGINYGYTLSMETLEIFTGLEKMIEETLK